MVLIAAPGHSTTLGPGARSNERDDAGGAAGGRCSTCRYPECSPLPTFGRCAFKPCASPSALLRPQRKAVAAWVAVVAVCCAAGGAAADGLPPGAQVPATPPPHAAEAGPGQLPSSQSLAEEQYQRAVEIRCARLPACQRSACAPPPLCAPPRHASGVAAAPGYPPPPPCRRRAATGTRRT